MTRLVAVNLKTAQTERGCLMLMPRIMYVQSTLCCQKSNTYNAFVSRSSPTHVSILDGCKNWLPEMVPAHVKTVQPGPAIGSVNGVAGFEL